MEGAFLSRFPVIPSQAVGQGPSVPVPGGVDQHPGGLIQGNQVLILIQNGQVYFLGRVLRSFFVQENPDLLSRLYRVIRMDWDPVHQQPVPVFQPVDEPCGHIQFPAQKAGQLSLPLRNMPQFHGIPPFVLLYHIGFPGGLQFFFHRGSQAA